MRAYGRGVLYDSTLKNDYYETIITVAVPSCPVVVVAVGC